MNYLRYAVVAVAMAGCAHVAASGKADDARLPTEHPATLPAPKAIERPEAARSNVGAASTDPATTGRSPVEPKELMYLAALTRDPAWEPIQRALLPPLAQGGFWHPGTKARVFLYVFPETPKGVIGEVQNTHVTLMQEGMVVEPVSQADDGSWAQFHFSASFPSGDQARGKLFARRLVTMPGLVVIAMGMWPAEHDEAMRGELDYIVATAHLRSIGDGPSEQQ